MNLKNKQIGIWGFGIVGKSLLKFLAPFTKNITITDNRPLSDQEQELISSCNATYYDQAQGIEPFLETHEILCISAGIDISNHRNYHHKLLPELDLFHHFFKKPIIAVTGTVGKTSTTTLIYHILKHNGIRAAMAGNIGIGLTDLIDQQDQFDCAVLELSSFQLEYCKIFAPHIAIWTNFFANHLDRHGTVQNYFNAKAKIVAHQNEKDIVIAPQQVIDMLKHTHSNTYSLEKQAISNLPTIPNMFPENITLACTAAQLFDPYRIWDFNVPAPAIPHRMEFLGTWQGVYFYNDSKATVPQATLAALKNLEHKSIILFLGGLSKGIDRSAFIQQLPKNIKQVICFGKEAEKLHTLAQKNNLNSSVHATLQKAFDYCLHILQEHDHVLFSPAGSSFDLFRDYQERGEQFKTLVKQLMTPNITEDRGKDASLS